MSIRDPNRYNGTTTIISTSRTGYSTPISASNGTKIINVVLPRNTINKVSKPNNISKVNVNTYVNDVYVQASPGPVGLTGPQGSTGSRGPIGPTGLVEEEVYSTRVDFINDNLLYKAEAAVGTLNAQSLWRIRRVTIGTDGDVTEEWANGNSNFTNVWDDRLLLTYS